MKYSEKIKASQKVIKAITSLKDEEKLTIHYGVKFKGKPTQYRIHAYKSKRGVMSYSIWSSFSGMNIDSIGKTTMKAYTYDMMSQRTNYNFPLYEIEIPEQDNI
jgi:hypothetical protein